MESGGGGGGSGGISIPGCRFRIYEDHISNMHFGACTLMRTIVLSLVLITGVSGSRQMNGAIAQKRKVYLKAKSQQWVFCLLNVSSTMTTALGCCIHLTAWEHWRFTGLLWLKSFERAFASYIWKAVHVKAIWVSYSILLRNCICSMFYFVT